MVAGSLLLLIGYVHAVIIRIFAPVTKVGLPGGVVAIDFAVSLQATRFGFFRQALWIGTGPLGFEAWGL